MSEALYYTTHDSAIGKLLIVASHRGARAIGLLEAGEDVKDRLARRFPTPPIYEVNAFFSRACDAIDRYLEKGEALDLPIDIAEGTALQRSVWQALRKIPYGETVSYTTLAERVGFPRAVRAVASACGANPLPLAIPCHRVIAKDGTLGGFSLGGLAVKEKLLAIESGAAKAHSVAAA